jgi:hypothetical protein
MAAQRPAPQSTSAPDLDILGDNVTVHPSGYIAPSNSNKDEAEDRSIFGNDGFSFRKSPFDFLRNISLHVSGVDWRAYDNIIGQPIFYSGFTENMKALIMSTPMLQQKIEDLAEKRVVVEAELGLLSEADPLYASKRARRRAEIQRNLQEVTNKMTDEMICKLESKRFLRGAAYLCTQLITRAYNQGQWISTSFGH